MTHLETLHATIDRFGNDRHAMNAPLARAELKAALKVIAHLEACLKLAFTE